MRRLSLLALVALVHAVLTAGAIGLAVGGAARQLFESSPATWWEKVVEKVAIVLASPLVTVASQLGADLLIDGVVYVLIALNSCLWTAALAALWRWRAAHLPEPLPA